MKYVAFLAVASLLVASCTGRERAELPQGVQTAYGTVENAELSLLRRGTHLLIASGREEYYLESSAVNLDELVGSRVRMQGTLQENTDPDALPVFVVTEILDREDATRDWPLPSSFGMSLKLPRAWRGAVTDREAIFTASGAFASSLRVTLSTIERAPFSLAGSGTKAEEMTPIVIASKRALRIRDAVTGAEEIRIDRGASVRVPEERVLVLKFSAGDDGDIQALRERIIQILSTISFHSEAKSSARTSADASSSVQTGLPSSLQSSSSFGAGSPCGGLAGILCPAGQYCDVQDLASNIGVCKKM